MVGTNGFNIDDFRKYLEEELYKEVSKKFIEYLKNDAIDDMLNGTGAFGPQVNETPIIGAGKWS